MEAKPKPFNVKLTEAERDALEAHRVRLGLRSHADVVRHWIAGPITLSGTMSAPQAQALSTQLMEPTNRFTLQVGPAKADPGSRLKKPKGKAS